MRWILYCHCYSDTKRSKLRRMMDFCCTPVNFIDIDFCRPSQQLIHAYVASRDIRGSDVIIFARKPWLGSIISLHSSLPPTRGRVLHGCLVGTARVLRPSRGLTRSFASAYIGDDRRKHVCTGLHCTGTPSAASDGPVNQSTRCWHGEIGE
jgi:hypothetical protein